MRLHDGTLLEFRFCVDAVNNNVGVTVQKVVRVWATPSSCTKESDYFVRIARRIANLVALINNHHLEPRLVIVHENDVSVEEHMAELSRGTVVLGVGIGEEFDTIDLNHPFVEYENIRDRLSELVTSWFESL